jgi:hypothetical protein
MSGSNNVGGKGAGLTTVASSVVLPFTGQHTLAAYVVLTALVCGALVLISKFVKSVVTR